MSEFILAGSFSKDLQQEIGSPSGLPLGCQVLEALVDAFHVNYQEIGWNVDWDSCSNACVRSGSLTGCIRVSTSEELTMLKTPELHS